MNRHARCAVMLALLAVFAAGTAGCQGLAYVLVRTVGPFIPEDEHKAEYDLSGRSVVVLVDLKDPTVASEFPRLELSLADAIGKVLAESKACGPVVPARSVEAARRTERGFARWPVARVGEYFNVDRVIHVELFEFRIKDSPESNAFRGYAEAAIRIVSPESDQQVWPMLAAARILRAETLPDTDADSEEAARQEQILVEGFGEKIAKQFCTYKLSERPIRPKVR